MFDSAQIGIPCPSCGKETAKSVAWLKSHKQMTCTACGTTFDIDAEQFKRKLAGAEKQLADFQRKLSRSFK